MNPLLRPFQFLYVSFWIGANTGLHTIQVSFFFQKVTIGFVYNIMPLFWTQILFLRY